MTSLTHKQKRVLEAITRLWGQEERPPTTRELASELGCHPKTIYQYLAALERKGAIERRKGRIHLAKSLGLHEGAPIVGRIAAGAPILAEENVEGALSLSRLFPQEEGLFALKVQGDSMAGAGIFDGDHVIVRQQPAVENGEIAAVLIEDEATVKRVFVRDKEVRLVPESPSHSTREYDLATEDVSVLGKVVGVVRKMG